MAYEWTTGKDEDLEYIGRIASGNYGEVHQLSQKHTTTVFVRKIVRPPAGLSTSELDEYIRPVDTLCDGQQKNIARVFRHGWLAGTPFYFFDMEAFDFTLQQYIHETENELQDWTPEKQSQVLNIAIDITRGLEFIHSRGFIHRDLKPNNVLCRKSDFAWKIADVGLASEDSSRRDITGKYSEGPGSYRAPELLREILRKREGPSTYNERVDIWALGCILYELLTSTLAFSNDPKVLEYANSKEAQFYAHWILVPGTAVKHLLAEMSLAMIHVSEQCRPSARDTLHTMSSIATWNRGIIWVSRCSHFIGRKELLTIIAPKWSHKIWRDVKWAPFSEGLWKGKAENSEENDDNPLKYLNSSPRITWGFMIPDDSSSCAVIEWVPFRITRAGEFLDWIRRFLGMQQVQSFKGVEEVSEEHFRLLWEGILHEGADRGEPWPESDAKEVIFVKLK